MKKLILTESFMSEYKDRQPVWGFGGLGGVVYKRTYSRKLPEGRHEEWFETVRRVVEGCYNAQVRHCERSGLPFNMNKGQKSAQKMYDLMFNMKFLPPGRGLEHMGADHVETRGSACLNNCSFVSTEHIRQSFAEPFVFLMDMSMLGVGVGGNCAGAGTMTMVNPDVGLEPFVIPDSREGWVDSVRILLDAFAGRGKLPSKFDYSELRGAGVPLKTFGGYSSGYKPLEELHNYLFDILGKQRDSLINSTTIVDIFNLIGKCVVSGGIRRTAEIMIGDPADTEFSSLKDPKLFPKELDNHRWASNNSLYAYQGMDYSKYTPTIAANGEPGFFWLDNARHYGRMKDGYGDWDIGIAGQNPCGEIGLESEENCNLVEVFPARHDSPGDIKETLKFAYLYAKSVTLIPTHNLTSNAIMGRNRRIGTSMSGNVQAIEKFGLRGYMNALDEGYRYTRGLDLKYSRWLCIPTSIKITTVKPSGTVSLLAGATPGVHFAHSQYYIRRVRFDKASPILPVLKKAGYNCDPSKNGDNTIVADFPVEEEFFHKSKKEASIWEQMEMAAMMQHYWSDNAVSVTVTFNEDEVKDLPRALDIFESRLKSISLMPVNDSTYQQQPYEEITSDKYRELTSGLKPIDFSEINSHEVDDKFCDGDSCTIPQK